LFLRDIYGYLIKKEFIRDIIVAICFIQVGKQEKGYFYGSW
jgi:hypothetical protein